MRFEDMSREEKVLKTYKDLQARKQTKKKAESDFMGVYVDNILRVRNKQFHSRINKFSTY